jgi:hypothetical protein
MFQWGFPQFYNQTFTQMPVFNTFACVNPFASSFGSIFPTPQGTTTPQTFNFFQSFAPLPAFNPFSFTGGQTQTFNFLNNQMPAPASAKPQGISSTLSNWYDSAVETGKKVVKKGKEYAKKGYEYAKKGYHYVKESVKELMEKIGYNAEKGQKLAQEARKGAAGRFKGKCATYVKKAVEKAGLGKYIYGVNGCDMAKVYGQNKHFKKISAKGINVKDLPAGCILCYDAGKSGHHKVYGHTGITQGNGTEISDGVTRNPKEASYILVPV